MGRQETRYWAHERRTYHYNHCTVTVVVEHDMRQVLPDRMWAWFTRWGMEHGYARRDHKSSADYSAILRQLFGTVHPYENIDVCWNCYARHHMGASFHCDICNDVNCGHEGAAWSIDGGDGQPCECEPLGKWGIGYHFTDNTDSNTGEGITEHSWSWCEGCGSRDGGGRHRLAVWKNVN